MTEDQIKQNAEQYYQKLDSITIEDPREPNVNSIIDAYIAGAHSRDPEIDELKKRIEELEDEVAQLENGENYLDRRIILWK